MWAGVGTETFQIQYCNMALPTSSQFATPTQQFTFAKQASGPIEVIFKPVIITGGAGCFAAVYTMTNTNSIPNLAFDATAIKMTITLQPTPVNAGAYQFTVNATYTTIWKVFTLPYSAFSVTVIDCLITATAAITAPATNFYNSYATNPVSGTGTSDITCIKEVNNCSLKIGTFTSTVT